MKSARQKGEERITKSVPHEVVEELASQKAIEVASMVRTYEETHQELVTPSDLMVIGADTIVSCGGQILGGSPKTSVMPAVCLSFSPVEHTRYTPECRLCFWMRPERLVR